MFVAGAFMIFTSFYGVHIVGWTLHRLFYVVFGVASLYSGYMELKKPRIIIIDNVVNFVTLKGKTWKSIRFNSDKIIVGENAVYLVEGEQFLRHKKLFSLWWTDASQTKLKNFFENLSISE
jgi:hypothetical protein